VIDIARRILVEDTDARQLRVRSVEGRVVVGRVALRHAFLREGNAVVEVEVVSSGGHPVEFPAHALLEGLKLREGRTGNGHQRHIVMAQVKVYRVDVVGDKGTTLATFLPAGTEHEVINHQLAAPVEEFREGHVALGPLKHILLLHLCPG